MAYTVRDINGAERKLIPGSKIVSIDGEETELYFNGVEPMAHRGRFPPALIGGGAIVIQNYLGQSNGAPVYGAPYTVKGQITWQEAGRLDPDTMWSRSKYSKEDKVRLVIKALRNTTQRRGAYVITAGDKANYLSHEDTHEIFFYIHTTTYNARGIQTGSTTSAPITIQPSFVELEDQYRTTEEGQSYKYGEARIGIPMSQITLEQLASMSNYFTISTNGGPAVKYFIWDGNAVTKQTNDYEVHLRRSTFD